MLTGQRLYLAVLVDSLIEERVVALLARGEVRHADAQFRDAEVGADGHPLAGLVHLVEHKIGAKGGDFQTVLLAEAAQSLAPGVGVSLKDDHVKFGRDTATVYLKVKGQNKFITVKFNRSGDVWSIEDGSIEVKSGK